MSIQERRCNRAVFGVVDCSIPLPLLLIPSAGTGLRVLGVSVYENVVGNPFASIRKARSAAPAVGWERMNSRGWLRRCTGYVSCAMTLLSGSWFVPHTLLRVGIFAYEHVGVVNQCRREIM